MFCTNCGAPLQPGAVFCNQCGNPVQNSQNQPAATPYTAPVEKGQGNAASQIPYTVPADMNGGVYGQNHWQPGESYSGFQPAADPSAYAPAGQPAAAPRRRKLPILLAAVAVAGILLAVLAGGKKEEPRIETNDKPAATLPRIDGGKFGPGEETKAPAPVDKGPKFGTAKHSLGKKDVRFDSEGFCFDLDGLKANYAAVLEENGSPFTIGGTSTFTEGDKDVYFWLKNDAGADVVDVQVVRDVATNRITKVYASQRRLEEGYEDVTEEEIRACLCMIPTCYGPLTEDQWNSILEQTPTSKTEKNTIYDVDFDGMSVWIHLGHQDNAFSVGCTIPD